VQGRPGMRPLVARFVGSLRRTVHQLRRAYADEDLATVRLLASQLKGASLNYGFPALASAALNATRAIDRQGDSSETRLAVRELVACCERVKAPPLMGHASQRRAASMPAPPHEHPAPAPA